MPRAALHPQAFWFVQHATPTAPLMKQLGHRLESHVPPGQLLLGVSHWVALQQMPPRHDAELPHDTVHLSPPHETSPPHEDDPPHVMLHDEACEQSTPWLHDDGPVHAT
jgi:hypothetical protein